MNRDRLYKKIIKEAVEYFGESVSISDYLSSEDKRYFIEYLRASDIITFTVNPTNDDYLYNIMDLRDGDVVTSIEIKDGDDLVELIDVLTNAQQTVDKKENVCYVSNT